MNRFVVGIYIHLLSCYRRQEAIKQGLLTAVEIPICVAQIANDMWPHLKELAKIGNINCKSDLQVKKNQIYTPYVGLEKLYFVSDLFLLINL